MSENYPMGVQITGVIVFATTNCFITYFASHTLKKLYCSKDQTLKIDPFTKSSTLTCFGLYFLWIIVWLAWCLYSIFDKEYEEFIFISSTGTAYVLARCNLIAMFIIRLYNTFAGSAYALSIRVATGLLSMVGFTVVLYLNVLFVRAIPTLVKQYLLYLMILIDLVSSVALMYLFVNRLFCLIREQVQRKGIKRMGSISNGSTASSKTQRSHKSHKSQPSFQQPSLSPSSPGSANYDTLAPDNQPVMAPTASMRARVYEEHKKFTSSVTRYTVLSTTASVSDFVFYCAYGFGWFYARENVIFGVIFFFLVAANSLVNCLAIYFVFAFNKKSYERFCFCVHTCCYKCALDHVHQ